MSEWRNYQLGELGRIITGKTPPTSNPNHYGGDIPFVTPSDMDGRRIIDKTARYLTEEGVRKVRSSYIDAPAIIVSCIGSDMGKAAIVDVPFVSNQQINSVIVGQGFDRHFVYYNLSARKSEIQFKASGAAQPIMNKTEFGKLQLLVPSFEEQVAVSRLLSMLDDKIELNRRMNETLEAMARAVFRDWFVDFGPTRAKMEGRAPYLSPTLWDMFPGVLNDQGIPEGWESWLLSRLADHQRATVAPNSEPETLFEHYSLPAYDSGQSPAADYGDSIKSNKTLVPANAVLLSKLNPEIQRVWIPDRPNEAPQVSSTEFLVYTPKPGVSRHLLYGIFTDRTFRDMLLGMVTGTSKSHQRVQPKAVLSLDAVVGTHEIFAAYDGLVSPMLERVLANRAESRTLAQTRDLLLPKLLSGEIRVRDAEKTVEAIL